MNKSIIIAIIALATQTYATALDNLKLPKGVKKPALHYRRENLIVDKSSPQKHAVTKSASYKQHEGKFILPPRGLISRAQQVTDLRVQKIKVKDNINDTSQIAVALKKGGYRLYKKKTHASDKNWMFWVKSQAGVPLFKVEVVWQDKLAKTAELFLWSWDDKTQMSLNDRTDLIKIFGVIQQ